MHGYSTCPAMDYRLDLAREDGLLSLSSLRQLCEKSLLLFAADHRTCRRILHASCSSEVAKSLEKCAEWVEAISSHFSEVGILSVVIMLRARTN